MVVVAVIGCGHGHLHTIYDKIAEIQQANGIQVELILVCGDFQAIRVWEDLEFMSVPAKYKKLGEFAAYYTGERQAPILTVFIGGNHENSKYMQELYYGGWVAPNIYYLGASGVIQTKGLRVGGISGIYNHRHCDKGIYERPPYDNDTVRSVYHTRQYEATKLRLIQQPLDIFLSHDWPPTMISPERGDLQRLLRQKPFLQEDIDLGRFGNPLLDDIVNDVKPSYWFAAHFHTKYAAIARHEDGSMTKFLSLSKVLFHQHWLQILDIPESVPRSECSITYDTEWLSIVRACHGSFSSSRKKHIIPSMKDLQNLVQESSQWLEDQKASKEIPGFCDNEISEVFQLNPQTDHLLQILQLDNPFIRYKVQSRNQDEIQLDL